MWCAPQIDRVDIPIPRKRFHQHTSKAELDSLLPRLIMHSLELIHRLPDETQLVDLLLDCTSLAFMSCSLHHSVNHFNHSIIRSWTLELTLPLILIPLYLPLRPFNTGTFKFRLDQLQQLAQPRC